VTLTSGNFFCGWLLRFAANRRKLYDRGGRNVVNGVLTATLVITVLKIKIRQNADLVVNN